MGSSAARRPLAAVVPQRQFQQALRGEQLTVHYQPIVALATQTISGVEALIRWQHPTGGLLPPADFLPAVAHSPVMRETTGWVLQRACRSTAGWPGWTVSVNVTAVDLTGPQLVRQVEDALAAASLPATRLVLELTEHSVVQDLATAVEVLSRLRELGVGVSLDDFGTGYSSLLYLRQLPVSQVKIDRVFVEGIADNDDDAAVVESVIHLAHAVGITAVAEGVERPDQLHLLKAMGCDAAQGFLFAKPAAEDAVVTTLAPTVATPSPDRRRTRRPSTAPAAALGALAVITTMTESGASLHTIAAALNQAGERTAGGTRWTAPAVARVLRTLT